MERILGERMKTLSSGEGLLAIFVIQGLFLVVMKQTIESAIVAFLAGIFGMLCVINEKVQRVK